MPKQLVVLVGQPNSGKTSLFNALTGSNQFVGNWPGVTVEKKEGFISLEDLQITLIDLPGCYSLTPYSMEETITSNFISSNHPSLILNIVDSTHLERHLFLTLQLIKLGIPMIVVLNMVDELEQDGLNIHIETLQKSLGLPVVKVIAREGKGMQPLLDASFHMLKKPITPKPAFKIPTDPHALYKRSRKIQDSSLHAIPGAKVSNLKKVWERLDQIALHPTYGLFAFFLVMAVMFWVTFSLGGKIANLLSLGLDKLSALSTQIPEPIIQSLIQRGILGGVGNVILLVPYIAILFLFFSLLEDSGYIGRVAYLMDRVMHKIGLHGKSIIPLILGFGCNVPAIMTARALESESEKIKTVMMMPFITCSGRLPVFVLLTSAFFGGRGVLVILSLYLLGIIFAILTGLMLNKTIFKEQSPELLMELSPYRLPYMKNIFRSTWTKVKQYLYKAGTLIFLVTIFLWFLSYFPSSSGFGGEKSMIGVIGKFLSPVLAPLGFDWKMTIALLSGFLAKELILSTMGVLYPGAGSLATILKQTLQPATIYVFLVFILLYVPCMATVAAIRSELNSKKWMFISIGWSIFVAWIVSFVVKLMVS
jgi:ferrous iron transport protein B